MHCAGHCTGPLEKEPTTAGHTLRLLDPFQVVLPPLVQVLPLANFAFCLAFVVPSLAFGITLHVLFVPNCIIVAMAIIIVSILVAVRYSCGVQAVHSTCARSRSGSGSALVTSMALSRSPPRMSSFIVPDSPGMNSSAEAFILEAHLVRHCPYKSVRRG